MAKDQKTCSLAPEYLPLEQLESDDDPVGQ